MGSRVSRWFVRRFVSRSGSVRDTSPQVWGQPSQLSRVRLLLLHNGELHRTTRELARGGCNLGLLDAWDILVTSSQLSQEEMFRRRIPRVYCTACMRQESSEYLGRLGGTLGA